MMTSYDENKMVDLIFQLIFWKFCPILMKYVTYTTFDVRISNLVLDLE